MKMNRTDPATGHWCILYESLQYVSFLYHWSWCLHRRVFHDLIWPPTPFSSTHCHWILHTRQFLDRTSRCGNRSQQNRIGWPYMMMRNSSIKTGKLKFLPLHVASLSVQEPFARHVMIWLPVREKPSWHRTKTDVLVVSCGDVGGRFSTNPFFGDVSALHFTADFGLKQTAKKSRKTVMYVSVSESRGRVVELQGQDR